MNSRPGLVPDDVLFNFGCMYGVVAMILVLSTRVFWPYSLNKARHEEIVYQLSLRTVPDIEDDEEPDIDAATVPIGTD